MLIKSSTKHKETSRVKNVSQNNATLQHWLIQQNDFETQTQLTRIAQVIIVYFHNKTFYIKCRTSDSKKDNLKLYLIKFKISIIVTYILSYNFYKVYKLKFFFFFIESNNKLFTASLKYSNASSYVDVGISVPNSCADDIKDFFFSLLMFSSKLILYSALLKRHINHISDYKSTYGVKLTFGEHLTARRACRYPIVRVNDS
ncbi:hypothetical protein AGLY_010950 [Aphis glycines]|uniref:Uncharacterized protein n=1 Tax=Aphis glycines TaxID=307491 RepID=A0A6G0TCN2_APHGL|nr:hypothetical protein AGLY_010950 [Aphis glycines]